MLHSAIQIAMPHLRNIKWACADLRGGDQELWRGPMLLPNTYLQGTHPTEANKSKHAAETAEFRLNIVKILETTADVGIHR